MAPTHRTTCLALAIAMSAVLPGDAIADAGEDPLSGPLASFTLARIYWTVSICACGTSVLLLLMLAVQWFRDPIYSEWPLQIYAPLLLADFLFSTGYLVHHVYNISTTTESNYSPSHMTKEVFCQLAWIGACGVPIRNVGYTALAWAPWHAIRCSKNFKRSNMRLAIVLWTIASLIVAAGLIIPWYLMTGTKTSSGLYCPSISEEPWKIALLQLSFPVISYSAFGLFQIWAHIECEALWRTAQVDSIRRVARESRNMALAAFAYYMFFNVPLVLQVLAFFLGLEDFVTAGYVAYAGMFAKFGPWGTVILLRHHAQMLRKRVGNHTELCLDFAATASDVEDIGPLENRGVSLPYMVSFVRQRYISANTSTEEVMQRHIKPESRKRKCCFVELVKTLADTAGRPAVKKPQYFVSHCWGDGFCSMLEQLAIFSDREERSVMGPFYFWVDIFAINQHDVGAATELPMIPRVIQSSQAVLFTLNPWYDPQTLRRVWCLWELLQAVKNDVRVRPTMPESEELHFLDTIWQDRSKISNMLDMVDVTQADATVLSDKETIFTEISTTMGFDAMNSMIKTNLRRCLQGVAVDRFFGFAGSIENLHSAFQSAPNSSERHSGCSSMDCLSVPLSEVISRNSKMSLSMSTADSVLEPCGHFEC